MYINPDLHLHSNFSDGSDSPFNLLENVRKAGVDIFALTDHDTYEGCFEIEKLLQEGDPKFIKGVELSCEDKIRKYHILGYCFNTNKDSIKKAIEITHNARLEKAKNRLNFLRTEYGFDFTKEDEDKLLSNKNPGRPHFVNLMLQYGYIQDKQIGFDMLAKYHGTEVKLTPEQAVDAILSSGGIPVLAHGIKGDGSKNLSLDEITTTVQNLKECGLMGLECFYPKYTEDQKSIMLDLANKYNLFVTAGSDYHGTNKPIKIGQTNNPNAAAMGRFYKAITMLEE